MRTFAPTLTALAALLFVTASLAADKPNIIYILADDLGYGDLSCYGQEKFATPHIDRLAAEGLKFTQHYAGNTVCAPSRNALMTGQHTGHTHVRGNKEYRPIGQEPIPASHVTVAELLVQAGYKTGAFGKWGMGFPGSEGEPNHQGFDEFFGYNCQRNAHTFYPTRLFHNREEITLDGKTYSHPLIMDKAFDFIRANKDRPFFCYLPVTIPHAAMHAPEADVAPFRKIFPQFEGAIGKYGGTQYTNPVAAFAAMMTILDNSVGHLVALLKELNIDDNTLILFTSDNGPHLEGGHKPDFFDSNGPLNGHKRSLTDGGIRVPLIARWPGTVQPGTTTDHISAFWDFLPTACEIAGVKAPAGLDGVSYLPTLRGQTHRQTQHEYLYWEFYSRGGKRAVRMGPWKAVQLNLSEDKNSPIHLYNVEADIAESIDLAAKHPEIIARVKEIFEEAHTPSELFKW
ncbi:MAG: arylsulfatase [Planctomycetota bacterium]|jgi:arylsulfatase A-like enzyme